MPCTHVWQTLLYHFPHCAWGLCNSSINTNWVRVLLCNLGFTNLCVSIWDVITWNLVALCFSWNFVFTSNAEVNTKFQLRSPVSSFLVDNLIWNGDWKRAANDTKSAKIAKLYQFLAYYIVILVSPLELKGDKACMIQGNFKTDNNVSCKRMLV